MEGPGGGPIPVGSPVPPRAGVCRWQLGTWPCRRHQTLPSPVVGPRTELWDGREKARPVPPFPHQSRYDPTSCTSPHPRHLEGTSISAVLKLVLLHTLTDTR